MTDIKIDIVDHNKAPKLEVGQVRYSEMRMEILLSLELTVKMI